MTEIDPADVMAKHGKLHRCIGGDYVSSRSAVYMDPPCEPYLLAEALLAALEAAERRGAVKALRRMGDLFRLSDAIPGIDCRAEGDYCHERADAVENGTVTV